MTPPGPGQVVTTLADQQQALLDAVFSRHQALPGGAASLFHGARGLLAYRSNSHAQAQRSLLAAYPVSAALLGMESFDQLARAFWHRHPPIRGDLAHWGGELAQFLQVDPQLRGEPYLADVARVEWALHQAATAADAEPVPASFALLADAPPERIRLLLTGGIAIVTSPYPVASIVRAHFDAEPALQEAGCLLQAGVSETARVWRQGLRPRVAVCVVDEAIFLGALLDGSTLAHALDQVPTFAFDQWLPRAVSEGLVLGAALAPA